MTFHVNHVKSVRRGERSKISNVEKYQNGTHFSSKSKSAYFLYLGQSRSTPPLSSSTASTNTIQERTSSTAPSDKTCYQAVRADGIPLCLFCKGPVDFVKNMQCSDWDARFCSYDCNKEYQVRNFIIIHSSHYLSSHWLRAYI